MKLYNYQTFNESKDHDIWLHHVHQVCKECNIKNYTINDDGSIDVDGWVFLHGRTLNEELSVIPLKFNRISEYFNCNMNKLESLKGAPNYVEGSFSCSFNQLTSLVWCPKYVGGDFSCASNQLTSLEGCPNTIMGSFYCHRNDLKDFKGFPEFYEGQIEFSENPVYEILMPIPSEKKCQFIHLVNEFDVIRDGKTIISDRLEEAYYGIGMELPDDINIYGYEII